MRLDDILATGWLAGRSESKWPQTDPSSLGPEFGPQLDSCGRFLSPNFVVQVMQLCNADSAGVSFVFNPRYDELTWAATAGALVEFQLRRFPRRHSMCGVVWDRRKTELFLQPHRYFGWMIDAGISIEECLVAPIIVDDIVIGTIWATLHLGERWFSSNDASYLELMSIVIGNAVKGQAPWLVENALSIRARGACTLTFDDLRTEIARLNPEEPDLRRKIIELRREMDRLCDAGHISLQHWRELLDLIASIHSAPAIVELSKPPG